MPGSVLLRSLVTMDKRLLLVFGHLLVLQSALKPKFGRDSSELNIALLSIVELVRNVNCVSREVVPSWGIDTPNSSPLISVSCVVAYILGATSICTHVTLVLFLFFFLFHFALRLCTAAIVIGRSSRRRQWYESDRLRWDSTPLSAGQNLSDLQELGTMS